MAKVEGSTQALEFALSAFNGITVSLAEFLGRKDVLLVFNRVSLTILPVAPGAVTPGLSEIYRI